MQAAVIILGEAAGVILLRLVIGRVTVEENALSVPAADQRFKVRVLDEYILKSAGAGADLAKEVFQIDRLGGDGISYAVEAPALTLIEGGGTVDAGLSAVSQDQALDDPGGNRREEKIRQGQLLVLKGFIVLLVVEKLAEKNEILAGVDGQEAQLGQQRQRAVPERPHEICEIAVPVVVDLRAARFQRAVEQHGSAAAEHVHKAIVVVGCQLVDDPQQLALATDPGKRCVQEPSPNLASAISSPSMAASRPRRIFLRPRIVA